MGCCRGCIVPEPTTGILGPLEKDSLGIPQSQVVRMVHLVPVQNTVSISCVRMPLNKSSRRWDLHCRVKEGGRGYRGAWARLWGCRYVVLAGTFK